MLRKDIIEKTDSFMRAELMKSAAFKGNTVRSAEYRIEHSCRVAHIAAFIAAREGFDEEQAFAAGLLHDIGYSEEMSSEADYMEHGRIGARIARPFLTELGYTDEQVNDMCYGIAIHVDDKADFSGERTLLALSVQDADNIDRFDALRLFENLKAAGYGDMPLDEQAGFLDARIGKLTKLRELPFGSQTALKMWQDKIDFQIDFLKRLRSQADKSRV